MNRFGCVRYSSLLEYSIRSVISAIRLVLIRNPWRVRSDKDRGSAVWATGTRVMDRGSDPDLSR
ncbi:hypothetical protein BDZ89DRAFT_1062612 [Hymenopellis radicata]|nr:hypothetical protein BDZ89DRAFT_1062612 [Hymenopellis radicata]